MTEFENMDLDFRISPNNPESFIITEASPDWSFIQNKSVLVIDNSLHFYSRSKIPNWWKRFWCTFLLGWEWKSL